MIGVFKATEKGAFRQSLLKARRTYKVPQFQIQMVRFMADNGTIPDINSVDFEPLNPNDAMTYVSVQNGAITGTTHVLNYLSWMLGGGVSYSHNPFSAGDQPLFNITNHTDDSLGWYVQRYRSKARLWGPFTGTLCYYNGWTTPDQYNPIDFFGNYFSSNPFPVAANRPNSYSQITIPCGSYMDLVPADTANISGVVVVFLTLPSAYPWYR